jgi:hypothetical protein
MPVLSAAQKTSIRATHTTDHDETVDLYRAPAMSANKRGDYALTTSGLACSRLWPASRVQKIIAAIPELAGSRVEGLRFVAFAADVRVGDELRSGTTKQKVEGVGIWLNVRAVGLSEVKP